MTTTIKTLSDGRTLATDGTDLYLDGVNVGPAQLTLLQQPKNGMISYAKTSAGNIGFTRADVGVLNGAVPKSGPSPEFLAKRAEVKRQYDEWNRLYNDGGAGYNPHAEEYREYYPAPMNVEPRHPRDY